MKKLLIPATAIAALLFSAVAADAITNGTLDTEHGYVGALTGVDPGGTERLCSGSLIGRGVFLTAGHCAVLSDVEVHFGDDLSVDDMVFAATEVKQHPNYVTSFAKPFDVAIVLFDQGDADIAFGQLAPANYVDGFTAQQLRTFTFETLGYGLVRNDTTGNSGPLLEESARRIATQSYLNRHNQFLGLSIHTNKGNGGGCFGDSGGPHLLDDLIVSLTSNGDGNCVATDNTQRIDQPGIRDWIVGFLD